MHYGLESERVNGRLVRCYMLPGTGRCTILYMDTRGKAIPGRHDHYVCVSESGTFADVPGLHLGVRVPFSQLPDGLKRTAYAFGVGLTRAA